MDEATALDRFAGSLVGTAVGDALGAGFEGWPVVDPGQVRALGEGASHLYR